VTTPKRGIGGTTLEALGTYAGERHISLFAAAFEEGFAHRVQARQLAPLLEFCEFINRLQWRAARSRRAGDARPARRHRLRSLAVTIRRSADGADALEQRQEFVNWLTKKGEEDGKTLIDLTQTIALINLLDKQGRSGPTPSSCRRCTRPRGWSSSTSS
jgi:ATP-dependent DNA helicase Rep